MKKDISTQQYANKGFTLVELLVVISIIALLLAVLMPSMQKAREQASTVICKSNMRQIGLAFVAYGANNSDKIVAQGDEPGGYYDMESAEGEKIYRTYWPFRLASYLGDNSYKYERDPQKNQMSKHPYICPTQKNIKDMKYFKISYGSNYGNLFKFTSLLDYKSGGQLVYPGPLKQSQIKMPSQIMAFMDSGTSLTSVVPSPEVYSGYHIPGYFRFKFDYNKNGIMDSMDRTHPYNGAWFWHDNGKKINATFCDGHSETLTERQWVKPEMWKVVY